MQRKPQLQPYRVDLRVGVLPPDAAALGETEWSKAHRVGQTSLCLKPHGGLRLPLPETTVPSAGVADFTITLDVMIDRTDWPAGAVGTLVDGLLEVDGDGELHCPRGVGEYEGGPDAARLRPLRWHRVVLAVNGSASPPIASTFVDGAAAGSSTLDEGTWALAHGAALELCAAPGLLQLRYVLVTPRHLSAADVEAMVSVEWDFNVASAMDQLQLSKEEARALALAPCFGAETPPPVWHAPAFLGEFCDPYVQSTGLDASIEVDKSLQALRLALQVITTAADHPLKAVLSAAQWRTLEGVAEAFVGAEKAFKEYAALVAAHAEEQADGVFEATPSMVSAALKTLGPGGGPGFDGPNVVDGSGFVVLPGGWADEEGNWYFVALVIERDAEGVKAAAEGDELVGTCRVAVCNPGGDGTA